MSEWVKVELGKGIKSREGYVYLRNENRLSKRKVWDSVKMSDRLGGR